MNARRVYLDHNASAPLRAAARAAVLSALDRVGNPSSGHTEGRAIRATVEEARRQVAALVAADPASVTFTASATEAANLVLTPGLTVGGRRAVRLLAGATEHPCVLRGHRFPSAELVPVTSEGVLDLDKLERAVLSGDGPVMLALQAANNESGVLQPVLEAAQIVHTQGGIVVCDAVQAAGRVPCAIGDLKADAVILSSHKLGGPKGAGALVLADAAAHIDQPLIRGGGQERGVRSGTEDVAAIAGFGAASAEVAASGEQDAQRCMALRDAFETQLLTLAPDAKILGAGAARLPNTSCFGLPGVRAATLLMALDLAGIAVSSGAACSSGRIGRSPILDAMAIHPHIDGVIRVSFGWDSRLGDEAALLSSLEGLLRRVRPIRAA